MKNAQLRNARHGALLHVGWRWEDQTFSSYSDKLQDAQTLLFTLYPSPLLGVEALVSGNDAAAPEPVGSED